MLNCIGIWLYNRQKKSPGENISRAFFYLLTDSPASANNASGPTITSMVRKANPAAITLGCFSPDMLQPLSLILNHALDER